MRTTRRKSSVLRCGKDKTRKARCVGLRLLTNPGLIAVRPSLRRKAGQIGKSLTPIPGPLGPRPPWRGTLSSPDPVPCVLS